MEAEGHKGMGSYPAQDLRCALEDLENHIQLQWIKAQIHREYLPSNGLPLVGLALDMLLILRFMTEKLIPQFWAKFKAIFN